MTYNSTTFCGLCNVLTELCHCWQVELILKLGNDILGDLHSYKRFQQEATELLDELRTWQQDAFAEWSRDVLAQIDDPNTPLRSVW